MPGIAPTTRAELSQRRQQLRRQRRLQQFQAVVRFSVVVGLAAAAFWSLRQPIWVIRDASQLRIEGNQYLSQQTLRKLVPITYPQSIFRAQPSAIADELKRQAPLAWVQVDRQLFPPELIVRVREQTPVAAVHSKNQKGGAPIAQPDMLLDAKGNVLPIERYQRLEQGIQLPPLQVLGDPKAYQRQWPTLYQQIRQQPIKIQQIDWRQPDNITLTTELGAIHLGGYNPTQLPRQMQAITNLRSLSKSVPAAQIDYIDLRNPDAPALQKKPNTPTSR